MDGKRMRDRRRGLGVTQAQLAETAGTAQARISQIENGESEPSIDVLMRLARALGVTTDYLLGRVDDPEANAQADPIYRDFKNRSEADRENIKLFMKFLEERSKK